MWIVIPLIYFMSWKSCRRFNQALNETAAWTVGYLGTAGAILLLDLGGLGMLSAKPNDPGAAVALLAGFVTMGISRYRWKKRGGHLEQTDNKWLRSLAAIRGSKTSSANATRKSTVARAAASSKTNQTTPRHRASGTTANSATTATRAVPARKSGGNRWARAAGAMLDTSRQPSKPARKSSQPANQTGHRKSPGAPRRIEP